jgi:hypothetical protein
MSGIAHRDGPIQIVVGIIHPDAPGIGFGAQIAGLIAEVASSRHRGRRFPPVAPDRHRYSWFRGLRCL